VEAFPGAAAVLPVIARTALRLRPVLDLGAGGEVLEGRAEQYRAGFRGVGEPVEDQHHLVVEGLRLRVDRTGGHGHGGHVIVADLATDEFCAVIHDQA
jgi:hypothetical protein